LSLSTKGEEMKALISPNEPAHGGYRVAEVGPAEFPVAPPLFWVDCSDEVVADDYYYDPADESIKPLPQTLPEDDPVTPTPPSGDIPTTEL
jgi:hypothetical protein